MYRQNGLSESAIENLYPLLTRRPPNHLMELRFIDCGMTGSQIELLCQTLVDADSRLRVLALVNATQTDRSFTKFLFWLRDSQYVREIDLSCTVLRTSNVGWPKLIEVVKEHNCLRSLNLSHNRLLED